MFYFYFSSTSLMLPLIGFKNFQPHGFFNCSPSVDVPPSPSGAEEESVAPKLVPSLLLAKL